MLFSVFIRVMMDFDNIVLGMERRVIPLQLLQSAKFHFFGNLIILPCVQSSGSSFSRISTKNGCKISAAVSGSVLKTSAHDESVPAALLFPRVAIVVSQSGYCCFPEWLLLFPRVAIVVSQSGYCCFPERLLLL